MRATVAQAVYSTSTLIAWDAIDTNVGGCMAHYYFTAPADGS
jgi:hypothetical protein